MGKIISLGRALAAISMIGIISSLTFSSVFAQEETESLKQRLDRLEKQNEDLRKMLEQKNGFPNAVPAEKELTKTSLLTNNLADILVLPTLGTDGKPADGKRSNLFKWSWKDGLMAETKNYKLNNTKRDPKYPYKNYGGD